MQDEVFKERRSSDVGAHGGIHNILVNIQHSAQEIKDRVISIELKQDSINSAFLRNDLGSVDYDGHRKDHLSIKRSEDTMDKYKFEVAKTILKWGIAALIALLASGALHKTAMLLGIPAI